MEEAPKPGAVVIPQPRREPVEPLRQSFNLDDLIDDDDNIILPEDD